MNIVQELIQNRTGRYVKACARHDIKTARRHLKVLKTLRHYAVSQHESLLHQTATVHAHQR